MILAKPILPKGKDGVLRVIIPGRISQPGQDIDSIASQHEDAERWLSRVYRGPVQVERLGEQASGWLAARDSMIVAQQLVESGEWDLVIATELREIYRNPEFHWGFVHLCLDNDVRFISVADNIDTFDENWEIMTYVASLRHGMTVPEARRRVRRKATYSFGHGGMVLKIRYGYRKLTKEEAQSGRFGPIGLRIAKVPECTPTIRAMRERILGGQSATQVADWLNDEGVPPGPYVSGRKWTRKTVVALLSDPVLSGRRRFRTNVHKMVYKTGKHRPTPNPTGPEVQEQPALAHITPDEQAELLSVFAARGEACGPRKGKASLLWNKPRARSLWPGQSAICGACLGKMYRYGAFLRCANTLSSGTRTCWNHVQIDMGRVATTVLPWVVSVLEQHPRFREGLIKAAWNEFQRRYNRRRRSGAALEEQILALEEQAQRLAKAIGLGGNLTTLVAELSAVEDALVHARKKRDHLQEDAEVGKGFTSPEEMAAQLDTALMHMVATSLDFADILRRLIPIFVIQPVQQLDYPQVRARAKLTLNLNAWGDEGEPAFEATTTLDLFERPLHIKHLQDCIAIRKARPASSLKQIAADLGIGHMTVKRALDYAQLMETQGLSEPYCELRECPASASRWTLCKPPDNDPQSSLA